MKQQTYDTVPIPLHVVKQMKLNRDQINPDWSLADYLEHVVASHTEVIERLKQDERNHPQS